MSNFTIQVNDTQVRLALHRLHEVAEDMQPIMQGIGEAVMERTKKRFVTSTDPAGNKWVPLAQSSYGVIADRLSKSKGNMLKDGRLSSKGAAKLANKRILIETRDLSRQFHVSADRNSVTISNSMLYAAIHQFGGQAGRNKKVMIPARPFLPVLPSGELYREEKSFIVNLINDYIANAIKK